MTCELFRARFRSGSEERELLGHLRDCDGCLQFAVAGDPDVLFRSLGGEAIEPPGGVDSFVDEVMREIRVRQAESVVYPVRRFAWRQWSIAAAVALALVSGILVYRPASAPSLPEAAAVSVAVAEPTMTRPIVESYQASNATIVEVPSDSDLRVVMIFDETLPADL